jgi:hypothetical protein
MVVPPRLAPTPRLAVVPRRRLGRRSGRARLFGMLAAVCLSLAAAAGRAVGQEGPAWSLTTADLSTEAVALKAVDAGGLKVASAAGGADRDVPMDRFVELARPAAAAPRMGKFDLVLVGGERVNGDPVAVKGDALVWRNPVAGEVPVPLRLAAALVKVDGRASLDRRAEDEVVLTNADVVRGAVTDLTAERVVVKVGDDETPIPLASVAAVGFASTAGAGGKDKPSFRVRLDEGSTVAATAVRLAGDRLELTFGTGPTAAAKAVPLARVARVEQVDGPVAFLSARPPKENVYTPYLGTDQRFLARFDADFDGNPIRFRDRAFPRSIAAHSYSRIVWPLPAGYAAFRTRYALDPKAGSAGTAGGDVTVRVKLDDKVVHEQAGVRGGNLSPAVVVDLGQAKTLTLEVDYGRQMDSNDRLNWLSPALLREKPTADIAADGK